MHLCADFHAEPSKEYLISFLFFVINTWDVGKTKFVNHEPKLKSCLALV